MCLRESCLVTRRTRFEQKGVKKAAQKKFFLQKDCKAFVQSMRVPDWVVLTLNWRYGRVSDESWQTIKTWDETTW